MDAEVINKFLADRFYSSKDFTVLLRDDELKSKGWVEYCHKAAGYGEPAGEAITSFEFQQEVRAPDEETGSVARIQVSRAFSGQAWSVTVRWEPTDAYKKHRPKAPGDSKKALDLLESSKDWKPETTYGFKDAKPDAHTRRERKYPFLFCIRDLVDCLYDRITEAAEPNQGLILVTGATNSAKSKIARALAWRRLQERSQDPKAQGRRPHLVTFEDPIEQFFWTKDRFADGKEQPAIDYTPRQRRKDCRSLEQGLEDALRQTPTVFYIGEIRDSAEIAQALDFGGTGHLAIATAHAGNLIEGVGKLLKAVNAANSGTRAMFAPKILAVIHLKMLSFGMFRKAEPDCEEFDALVPAMYRRTPRGLQSLVADGLASVMPYFPGEETVGQFGSLGRQYFARTLCRAALNPEGRAEGADNAALADRWQTLRQFHTGDTDQLPEPFESGTSQRLIDAALEEDLYGR
jgi:Type II/IV secretion system protein